MARKTSVSSPKTVESIQHSADARRNIPTAEYQPLLREDELTPVQLAYARRNPDLDPQLVWRGKDLLSEAGLTALAPPIYIQEKIQPQALIEDLRRQSARGPQRAAQQLDLFADFDGLPEGDAKTEFYQHAANWSNRMILGDSLQVMASLAEREGLRGQVQMIYLDPPYGIKFNSNFQWSTTSRDVTDGKVDHITREPEQVKAFRDTWRDGIHSYLSYLRDRLILARDLLAESGSIFVQIGDENVAQVKLLLDEVLGVSNFVALISYAKTTGFSGNYLSSVSDYLIWYAKSIQKMKYRALYDLKEAGEEGASSYKPVSTFNILKNYPHDPTRLVTSDQLTSQGASENTDQAFLFRNESWLPSAGLHWKTTVIGLGRLANAGRIIQQGKSIRYARFVDDFAIYPRTNLWKDVYMTSFSEQKTYVVQTGTKAIARCILMTSDPGDLVLDPTCGSGTTAYAAEQWGRRWITIDTSRVALALARMRLMGARYPYYLLKDSRAGRHKEAELTRTFPADEPVYENVRHGFVYERVPHITLKSIANNAEIDVIYADYQAAMEPLRAQLNALLATAWEEWQIPREAGKDWPGEAQTLHAQWQQQRLARQKAIDASIAAQAETEYLYDKPYEDRGKVRVAGPFTVESLSPHRVLGVDENDELIDRVAEGKAGYAPGQSFEQMILDHLKTAGVQQARKADKIVFSELAPWPGTYICAAGRYVEGGQEGGRERRAGVFIGPEFGTASRPDLAAAAREAGEAGFDVLVACAFNFDAPSSELSKLGAIPVLKARMNADLHMAGDLKNTGKGNLFVIFGEPDIDILAAEDGQVRVRLNGVDVFDPASGAVRSDSAEGIACWFIDSDYNEESFFVRQAYFLGANDPYSALKTSLKAEIDREAWESLRSDISRPFDKPASGRIAVKVINHLGDEVMKVFRV